MMKLSRRAMVGGAIGLLIAEHAAAQEQTSFAIVGASLWDGKARRDDAVIVIEDGKIKSVGTRVGVAAGAKIIDGKGKVVTAGLIDLMTHMGVVEVDLEQSTIDYGEDADKMDPVRAAFRTADGYNPASSIVRITRQHGVTSVGVVPRGNYDWREWNAAGLVTGQSAWVDLDGDTPDQAIANKTLALHLNLNDTWFGRYKGNRASAMLRLRELFDDAAAYKRNKAGYEQRQMRQLVASRLDLEVVVRALDGALPTIIHVDRASDIINALALAKEHGLNATLASAAEGWKVAKQIASANVGVAIYGLDHGPRSFQALYAREDNAARLHKAGVRLALSTGETHNARKLRQVAGNAVRAGLPHAAAIDAVTENPARILGMKDYGALDTGRIANVAIWSGDPFELSSRCEQLLIRGRNVSLRSRQTALFERYR